MRRICSFLFAAVAMISAVSCNQELMDGPVVADKAAKTLTAMFDGAETKALLSEGTKTSWEYLDTILVYNGYYTSRYVTHVKDSSYVAEFEVAEQDEALAGDKFIAVYPLWADGYMTSYVDIDRLTIDEVYLEKNQKARAGSYDPRTAISMAYTEDTTLVFKNATALLKFQVLNEGVKSVTVWTHNGEPIAGSWSLDYNDGEPVATPFESNDENDIRTANWVELHAGDKTFEVGKDYYISVFPQVAESGFTVEFCFEGSSKKLAAKSTDNSVEFQRNVILNLGAIEFTGEVPVVTGWGIAGELNAWGETADDIALKQYEDGLFVAYEVEFPDGEFKIRKNNDWSEGNYGMKYESVMEANHAYDVCAEGANMYVSAGIYDIWLDENAKRVYVMEPGVSIDEAVEPSAPVETWYLVGDFNGWTVADEAYMMEFVDGWYVCDLTLDTAGELKFNTGSWDVNRGGATFELYTDLNVWHDGGNIAVPAGSYVVYLSADASIVRFEGEVNDDFVPSEDVWGIVGALTGWGSSADIVMDEVSSGVFVAYEVVFDSKGGFKIRANGEWNDSKNYGLEKAGSVEADHVYNVVTGSGSGDMLIAAGTYDIWFDLNEEKVYIMTPGNDISNAQTPEVGEPVEETWYLVGNFNGWTPADSAYQMTLDGDYYVYYDFEADGKGVKFVADANWSVNRGGSFAADQAVGLSQGGSDIFIPAGTYDIFLSKDTYTAWFMTPGVRP